MDIIPYTRDAELTAYIAILRDALQCLVDGVTQWEHAPVALKDMGLFSLGWRTDHAREVLRMETGRHAQQELDIEAQLVATGYTLADWCWYEQYGKTRSANGRVPTQAEVQQALADINQLTEASWALADILT